MCKGHVCGGTERSPGREGKTGELKGGEEEGQQEARREESQKEAE
jgi:hypothetical protein